MSCRQGNKCNGKDVTGVTDDALPEKEKDKNTTPVVPSGDVSIDLIDPDLDLDRRGGSSNVNTLRLRDW